MDKRSIYVAMVVIYGYVAWFAGAYALEAWRSFLKRCRERSSRSQTSVPGKRRDDARIRAHQDDDD
jgi:hypothetical protein